MNDRRRSQGGWKAVAFGIGLTAAAHAYAGPAPASPPDEQAGEQTRGETGDVTVLINMRALDADEQEIYLHYDELIKTQIPTIDDSAFVVAFRDLVDTIDGLPDVVRDATKHSLKNKLIDALNKELASRGKKGSKHLADLLDSGNPQVVGIAVSSIRHMPDEWWAKNDTAERGLIQLLRSTNTSSAIREDVMWTFFLAGRMERARNTAIALAASGDTTLARTAAFLGCAAMSSDDFEAERVISLFGESSGILRQEAAMALARFYDFETDEPLQQEVILELVSVAKDSDQEPIVRGKAIEQLRQFAEDKMVLGFLLGMLDPANWFFGVPDNHGPSHSLVAVVEALRGNKTAAIRPALLKTQARLNEVPEDQRMNVEIALKISLERYDNGDSPPARTNKTAPATSE